MSMIKNRYIYAMGLMVTISQPSWIPLEILEQH